MSTTTSSADARTDRAREVVAAVLDPELPVLTIEDLGILRDVSVDPDGVVHVTITPTYSGCPAVEAIIHDVRTALSHAGFEASRVATVLSPAWTTDWMTSRGREKLAAYGVAPPPPVRGPGPVHLALAVRCPQCGSPNTEELTRFASTACKALWRCRSCREPFDHFKAL